MSDITASTGFVTLDKDGYLSLDGVRVNIRELMEKIDTKPTVFFQATVPTEYSILDWWFNPADGVLCIGMMIDNKKAWKETSFGVNTYLKSLSTGTDITATVLNNIMNDFYARVSEVGCKIVGGELVKTDGSLTNGELAFRKTKVINYIYNGDLSLPPVRQTGGKVWNRDKNGFCKTDHYGFSWCPFVNPYNYHWNYDAVYNYVNKTYTLSMYDKVTSADTLMDIGIIYGETALELIGTDQVFSMDLNVTKATTAYLIIGVGDGHSGGTSAVYNVASFSLTPGRSIYKQVYSIPNISALTTLTLNRKNVVMTIRLCIENTTVNGYGTIPAFTGVQNNTFTFYGLKLNKGGTVLDNIKNDFKNMDVYKELYPTEPINTTLDNVMLTAKPDFSAIWSVPGWCTVTTYKTILNDGTVFTSRDAESQEILTAMGYAGTQYFENDIIIKKIVWTARDNYALPYYRFTINPYKLFTTAAFVKLLSGTLYGNYTHGAELNKWKLCGSTSFLGLSGYTSTIHPYDNNSTGTGGGQLLIAMPGVVSGHVDLSNPTNWRIF